MGKIPKVDAAEVHPISSLTMFSRFHSLNSGQPSSSHTTHLTYLTPTNHPPHSLTDVILQQVSASRGIEVGGGGASGGDKGGVGEAIRASLGNTMLKTRDYIDENKIKIRISLIVVMGVAFWYIKCSIRHPWVNKVKTVSDLTDRSVTKGYRLGGYVIDVNPCGSLWFYHVPTASGVMPDVRLMLLRSETDPMLFTAQQGQQQKCE
eukprot:GHVN01106211.1.p2 GENE.GHVN01106211.1~~GHVN01106211.1.p2  ORF type:complete len:206 (-),score=57.68 GHVN01106211.1:242-859(-)